MQYYIWCPISCICYKISVVALSNSCLHMSFYGKAYELLISISPITCDIIFLLLQNDKDVFMESLICRLDDNCEKLLICKLDLECKKTLHFDSEISMPQVSVCSLDHSITFFLLVYFSENYLKLIFLLWYSIFLQSVLACRKNWSVLWHWSLTIYHELLENQRRIKRFLKYGCIDIFFIH